MAEKPNMGVWEFWNYLKFLFFFSSGWRDSAQPWVHPGQSDLSQEAADPGGWESSGNYRPLLIEKYLAS